MVKKLVAYTFFIFISCKDCRDIQVPYYEEEPYEAIEDVDYTLTFIAEEPVVGREMGLQLLGVKPKAKGEVTIKNTSNYGGVFEIEVYFKRSLEEEQFRLTNSKYIDAGATETIQVEKEIEYNEATKAISYNVFAPTKTIQKSVTKFRTITKYRPCNTCEEECE